MTRDGDITELGCHSGKLTWTLECVDNQWVGAVGNCGDGNNCILCNLMFKFIKKE